MGTCINHPDRETPYICMKHQIYLCEECLACKDPDIYCKHRSACPIWFMSKRKQGWNAEDNREAAAAVHTITFLPDKKTISMPAGSTLLDAAQAADVHVNASCNGKGSCGKCKLVLVTDIDPMLKQIPLTLEPPTLEDSVSDLDRLNRGLKKTGCDVARLNVGINVMRQLSEAVRQDNWNITMAHLLLQIEPRYIRRDPYIPTVSDFPILKAGEIGLKANPVAAVFIMPGPASYVGGDIVSGILYTGFHREAPTTLFINIGTNGEIALGNNEWLMTAACSAGPAFEGGGIRWGMRAEEGAIEKVTIDPQTLVPELSTVGDAPARGICGSGMIDLISELLKAGIVDRSGQFSRELGNERVRQQGDEWACVLTFAEETPMDEDIVFTASDLKNLVYSKGAYMALLSTGYRQEAREICNSMTYIDFSSNPKYMDEFTSALFLPHTDIKAFPTVLAVG